MNDMPITPPAAFRDYFRRFAARGERLEITFRYEPDVERICGDGFIVAYKITRQDGQSIEFCVSDPVKLFEDYLAQEPEEAGHADR